jgi:ABC-type transport system involved in multi-copper enzyme maturation permease subunit
MTLKMTLLMTLNQIYGIASYEFRMHWRRRGLLVVTLAMFAVLTVPVLLMRGEMKGRAGLGPDGVFMYTQNITLIHWAVVGGVLFAIMPFLFADAIPRDRQLGVSELLNTVPLPRYAYLIGKMSGAWLSTLSTLVLLALTSGLIWWFLIAPFDLSIFVPIWIVGGLAMALMNIGLIVPMTAASPNSRIAILICIGLFVLVPLAIGLTPRGDWLDGFSPLRPGLFYHYLRLPLNEPLRLMTVEWTIAIGLIQVAVIGVGMWAWLRLRDAQ